MQFTKEQIRDFINTPVRTLEEIYSVAKDYGVPAAQIEEAMGLQTGSVKSWTDDQGKVPLTAGLPVTEQVDQLNQFYQNKTGLTMTELVNVASGFDPQGNPVNTKEKWEATQPIYDIYKEYNNEYQKLNRYKGADLSSAVYRSVLNWDDTTHELRITDNSGNYLLTVNPLDSSLFLTYDRLGTEPSSIATAFAAYNKYAEANKLAGWKTVSAPEYIPKYAAGSSDQYLIKETNLDPSTNMPLHIAMPEPSIAEVMSTLKIDPNTVSLIPSNFFKYADWEKIKASPDPMRAVNETLNYLHENPDVKR